jgi:hypothetical protein
LGGTFNLEAGNPGVLKGDSALEPPETDLPPAEGDRDLGDVCIDDTYHTINHKHQTVRVGMVVRTFRSPLIVSSILFRGETSINFAAVGRTKTPWPGLHEKYDFPWTVPLCFPVGVSSSTPTHFPAWKLVVPVKRTVPVPAAVDTRFPTAKEESIVGSATHNVSS